MNLKSNNETIDLKELFFSILNQWKLIMLCMLVSFIIAILYLRVTLPTYSTNALVQVEDGKSAASIALLGQLKELSGSVAAKSPADAEIEILKSRLIITQVIHNLNLNLLIKDNQDSFLTRLVSSDRLEVFYNSNAVTIQKNNFQFQIKRFDLPQYYLDKPLILDFIGNDQFTIQFKDHVLFTGRLNQLNQLNTEKGIWKIEISMPVGHPQQNFTLIKQSIPSAMDSFLENYSVSERGKLTGVIGLEYRGHNKEHITHVLNNVLDIYHQQNIERKTLESKQTLNFLDKQLPELRQQLLDSEIKFNQFRRKNNTVDVSQESELLLKQSVELEKTRIELKQKQAELKSKYTDDHPLMTEVTAQLNAINSKISELNHTLSALPELQRLYLQLYRDVKVNTELYTSLLNNYQQLKVAQAGEVGSVRIIDTAIEPVQAIKPRKFIVILMALIIGGFIGTMLSLLQSMLKQGIKTSTQIEEELDLAVFATIPRSPIQENRAHILKKKKSIPILAVRDNEDMAIESLRSIRTTIHFALAHAKNNVISISGPEPEVGKSFISANLAVIFAQSNKKVLLIDADLRRGYLHKYFNQSIGPGLSDYLHKQVDLKQCLHTTHVENLDFISRGKNLGNPSEILVSDYFQTLLQNLSSLYDHIIIDTPPVLAVTDAIIVSQYAAVNLIVVRHGQTLIKTLDLAKNRYEQAGSKINGVILNDIQRSIGYGSGYRYNYSYHTSKHD
ncbi:polysaccharide biosynthesis tyrosine autokinase [Acinetobacter rudis]|uniref:Polysaccharide biosynthesis tyrosine autokinase n=1 Tax=Acinetobacter rudis TaxID=632955 RepID=A0AAW8J849_9GAMM|nr:polysaccharide biosynthesis tyrosine autokinase [Acinetobacter rudis]MDQ8935914.1 polysaccharide biosynthesis tyrosine autokinase [Acinetobacter rudis]MDQ8953641.1 polysaccharide biosynthesis tyrosine autokinase [Acinetobacter rudis]MDQ9018177.1 polysaccharide biosynthesis tyrosine autokinase [Acinetobacter rudis]